MPLADWFSTFCDNIQVKDGGTISTRYKAITRRLNTDFWTTTSETDHSLYVGSYGRNSAIQGFSDLDMLFAIPTSDYKKYESYQGNGQSALLQAVKCSIGKTYSSTTLSGDGQVVVISFTDGLTFEVVPAFLRVVDSVYLYPDTNDGGSWKTTDPRAEILAIRMRNAACNGNLIRLCRMMRSWKGTWTVPIGGLLIDTLAYQFIDTWGYKDKSFLYYDYLCRDFFKFMSEQDPNQQWWKALGSGSYVYRKGLFEYKAKQCYNIALAAIEHEMATPKQEWSAKNKWRQIFGTAFPD